MTIQLYQARAIRAAESDGWMVVHVHPVGGNVRIGSNQTELENDVPNAGAALQRGIVVTEGTTYSFWWRGPFFVIATGSTANPNGLTTVYVNLESFASDAPPPAR